MPHLQSRFERIIRRTACPYAAGALIRYAPKWIANLSPEQNTVRYQPDLDRFIETGARDALDMFVIEVRGVDDIHSLEGFSEILYRVLFTFHNLDPHRTGALTDGITTLDWDFVYRGVRFFIPTFAPFYDTQHPRYSHHAPSAFIVLQPDHCFTRRGICRNSPSRELTAQGIRDAFAERGSPYDVHLVSGSPKAERYIKPLKVGDPPVRWWVGRVPEPPVIVDPVRSHPLTTATGPNASRSAGSLFS